MEKFFLDAETLGSIYQPGCQNLCWSEGEKIGEGQYTTVMSCCEGHGVSRTLTGEEAVIYDHRHVAEIVANLRIGQLASQTNLVHVEHTSALLFEKQQNDIRLIHGHGGLDLLDRLDHGVSNNMNQVMSDLFENLFLCHYGAHVIHGDIKPNNVVTDKDGRSCLIDYNLCSIGVLLEDQKTVLAEIQHRVYNPAFRPPEMFPDENMVITSKADVWAMGMMIAFFLSGLTSSMDLAVTSDEEEMETSSETSPQKKSPLETSHKNESTSSWETTSSDADGGTNPWEKSVHERVKSVCAIQKQPRTSQVGETIFKLLFPNVRVPAKHKKWLEIMAQCLQEDPDLRPHIQDLLPKKRVRELVGAIDPFKTTERLCTQGFSRRAWALGSCTAYLPELVNGIIDQLYQERPAHFPRNKVFYTKAQEMMDRVMGRWVCELGDPFGALNHFGLLALCTVACLQHTLCLYTDNEAYYATSIFVKPLKEMVGEEQNWEALLRSAHVFVYRLVPIVCW